ncbi:MAG: sugar O-acetyltransferase [Ruminococcus sp.]|nr:sugar O-acetyltransferase [Ruminococcus sp.]
MTEREKMLAGQLYDCGDAELLTQWHKAKDLVRDYNSTDSANAREKERILDELLGIGNNALIAPNVQIYTAFHPTNAIDRFGEPKEDGSFAFCKTQTAPVTIGDNVWIGGGAIIMPGVTIGDNVVIGAGSVVTKDIPDNTIAYGNPCRVIRENR